MSYTPHLKSSDLESFRLRLGHVFSLFTITGNTTDANSSATSANPGVLLYIEEGTDSGDPTVADSGNGFTTLDDDASPAVVGVLVMCGDADTFYDAYVRKFSGDLTSQACTKAGASTTGVTASYNLSMTFALTGVDIDNDTNVQKLGFEAFYKKRS